MTVAPPPPARCLNCGSAHTGKYCSECGQPFVNISAPTWHATKEAVTDAIDLDGRALMTTRALVAPGRLTAEFLEGRRVPYVSPVKLFLFAGTVLTTTWMMTRGVDAHFYGMRPYTDAASSYINRVVRGSLAAAIAIGVTSWLLSLGRRRFLDDAVFAGHLVAALMLWTAATLWIGTGWKELWGSAGAAPHGVWGMLYGIYLPAGVLGLGYIVVSVHRVYRGRWWATLPRALVIAFVGLAATYWMLVHTR